VRPHGRLDQTPIGIAERVVVLDPISRQPLPVQMVDPATLTPNPAHPRDGIDARDSRYLAGLEEMRVHGVRVPLVAFEDGFLFDGHRRLATALELGLRQVPVCHLNAAQVRAVWATYDHDQRAKMLRLPHIRWMFCAGLRPPRRTRAEEG
jgi:hypothetical protein